MNKNHSFRRFSLLFCCALTLISFNGFAQVGIGNTDPNANALLEIGDATTTTQGLLIPRVNLLATNDPAPMLADELGMIVYNKNTNGAGNTAVSPGFYYNDGIDWIRIAAASVSSSDWTITGNSGTAAGTNFLGTTDSQALRFRTRGLERFEITDGTNNNNNGGGRLRAFFNGSATTPVYSWQTNTGTGMYQQAANVLGFSTNGNERMRLLANGQVVINNTAAPFAVDRFTVKGAASEYAINGYTTNGVGVYGENSSGAGYGVYGNSSNIGILGFGGLGALLESPIATGFGLLAVNTHDDGTGVLGIGNNIVGVYLPEGSGVAASGLKTGIYAYAGNGNTGNANQGNAAGYFELDTDNDPDTFGNNNIRAVAQLAGYDNVDPGGVTPPTSAAKNSYYGGYFSGGNISNPTSYAFVGMRYWSDGNGNSNPSNTIDYKIVGSGVVSTLVKDESNTTRVLFAPEAPEIVFQDYGVGQLINGEARITIDPILKKSIHVDSQNPLKVFVTLEGDCNGVYVTNKSADGFTVKELQRGSSSVPFSWQIVATRADTKDINGRIVSKSVGIRFPEGPGPLKPKAKKKADKDHQMVSADAIKSHSKKTAQPVSNTSNNDETTE